jgi:diguanylate cyclase (GGDEF)-like protein
MPFVTSDALRSPGSAQDLFLLGAMLLVCFIFALEYDLLQSAETMTPQQRRLSLAEVFGLAGVLMVGLVIFAARRLTEQRLEFERRLAAERDVRTARRQAYSDSLTGLPNRRALTTTLDAHLKDIEPQMHALMLLDLNRFKAINDRYGHQVGDRVLECIGQRMKAVVNDHHFAARLGGDEFAIFCPDTSEPEVARGRANAVIAAVEKPIVLDGVSHSVGVSVGIAFYPRNASTRTDLMRSADDALYRAKTSGGSAVHFADQ